MELVHFYHVWADGRWQLPLAEHIHALEGIGLSGTVLFGVVGALARRNDVWRWIVDHVEFAAMFEADDGSEALTINRARVYAQTHDGAVLYAHTKGAATVEPFRDRWRRSMTARVVSDWPTNLALLEDHDAVGCHWLTEDQFPGMFGATLPPFFGGNFWMARCDYLRTLPPCPPEPRYEAERWIGLGNPRVVDLLPGWPHDNRWPELCG